MARRPAASERVRLAAVSDAVYPWHHGGKEMRQHELWRRLAAHGVDVHVFTMQWWGEGDTATHDGVTFHAICPAVPLYAGARRSIRQGLVFALSTLRMARYRFDVLDADVIPFLHVPPLRLVASLRRRPFTVTWHEYWGRPYWTEYLGPRGHIAAAVERLAAALPTTIIAASEETARRIRAHGGTDVVAIPNGVTLTDVRALAAGVSAGSGPAAGASPSGPLPEQGRALGADLIVVGRLLAHKNVHLALDALALLRDQGQALTMTVIGVGPEADRLRAQAGRLGLEQRVRFAGSVAEHADVLAAVAASRVLLFPSVREGFGMVALESLAVGTPVITSDHPDNAAKDLIEDGVNGVVCAPTAQAIAAAVPHALALAGDPAIADSVAGYDWDALAAKAASTYRRVAQRRRA